VNLDAWNKLGPANQKIIEEVATRLEPTFWEAAKAEDSKNFDTLKAKGMQINKPPGAVLDFMVAKGKPSWAAFRETVPPAKPLIDKYLSAVGK
jgi:TRAP-type C4-dicarboxylate transport system substrate-binding protein